MAAVVFAIVAATTIGIGAERRWGSRAQAAAGRMFDAMLYGVMPFVTFVVVGRLELTAGVGAGLLFGYAAATIVGALAFLIGDRLFELPRRSTGALVCAAMLGNTGYVGLPLTVTLLGGDQLGAAIAYDTVITSSVVYIGGFAVGAALGDRAGDGAGQRVRTYLFRNPVLVALVLALPAPAALVPDAAVDFAEALAVALLPVGFLILGINLSREHADGVLEMPVRMLPAIVTALCLRLVVAPGLVLAGSVFLLRVPDAYLLQAAMPTAINALLVAHVFGLDVRMAAGAVAWSTAVVVVAAVVVTVVA